MNYQYLTTGLLWALSLVLPGESSRGNIVEKSLQRATFECNQYLNARPQCQARCEALVLRSWNDSSGLQYISYSRHFRPDRNDVTYLNRTLQCLDDRMAKVPCQAVCAKASIYKQCYLEQWGNLVRTPQLVPMPKLILTNTILQCAQMLHVNPQEMDYFARNKFDVSDRSRCLLRCITVRQGLFSAAGEPNLERLYVQCGGYKVDEASFKHNARACVDRIRIQGYDSCMFVTRIINDCFTMETGPIAATIINTLLASGVALLSTVAGVYGAALEILALPVHLVAPYLESLGIDSDSITNIVDAIIAASGTFVDVLDQ